MVNQKRSGTDFERKITKRLDRLSKLWKWKRVAGSGALGTILKEPGLTGDIIGKAENVPFAIKLEAKFGYGGSKQLTIKKEWLDKISKEAFATRDLPALVARFKNARDGVEEFVCMDIDTFVWLIDYLAEILNLEEK